MNDKMTSAQKKLYDILLLNLFKNKGSTFPKNRDELKEKHRFFKILDETPGSKSWYGLNTIMIKIVGLIKEKDDSDLLNIIRASVLDTLGGDCSLKKIEYEKLNDCLRKDKKTLWKVRYRTTEVVTIEENPKADDIIKNAIKRLFINILIDSKNDTLFQKHEGIYYLGDGSKHCFQDEIDVKSFKDIIATFDDHIFQNQEIKKLIETWANELGEVLKNDRKTLENKQKTNNNMEIEKKSNGAGSFGDSFYNENDKDKKVKKDVIIKEKDSKKVTYSSIFKEVANKKKKKNKEKEKSNDINKDGYFKDSKEEVKNVEKKDNCDKVRDQANEFEKKSNSKKEESNIDSNNNKNDNKEKDVVLEGMSCKQATNHNNNCDCLTSFKEGLKNCFF